MSKLAQTIQDFIALVDAYFAAGVHYARAEKTACRMATKGKGAHALDAAIPDYLTQFKAAREKVLTAAPALAQALERAGVDSRDLLRLHNAVGGPGGSAAIRKLWPKLKAELQRAGIQRKTEPAKPEAVLCKHSADFRFVCWHGTDFSFTRNQAACVKEL